MNKEQAFYFLTNVYQDIVCDMRISKIPTYFSDDYFQTTDGISTDIQAFTSHILTLKKAVNKLIVSDFHDFLFDERKQTATLRYVVNVDKKDGEKGDIEVIAIFEIRGGKIVRCHEQSCPLTQEQGFSHLANINQN